MSAKEPVLQAGSLCRQADSHGGGAARIHHHVAWFDAAQIIDAMLVNFNLEDDDSDLLDEALLQHDGTTVVDLDPLLRRFDAASIPREGSWR